MLLLPPIPVVFHAERWHGVEGGGARKESGCSDKGGRGEWEMRGVVNPWLNILSSLQNIVNKFKSLQIINNRSK